MDASVMVVHGMVSKKRLIFQYRFIITIFDMDPNTTTNRKYRRKKNISSLIGH